MTTPKPFEIRASDADLEELRFRLSRTRWPQSEVPNEDWAYGANTAYIKDLAQFWHDCDWRAQEEYLNGGLGCQARHFKINLAEGDHDGGGLSIHYVHAKASSGVGVPLLLLHGWPGSWFEFHKLFAPLTDAGFDVVAPSLPGYGYSEAPRVRGYGRVAMAKSMNQLMHQLGYPLYVAQGGDWGSMICRALGQLASRGDIQGPKAIHTNMVSANGPKVPADVAAEIVKNYTDHDKAGLAGSAEYRENDSGYSKIQGTKPQTLGVGLNDSPAGLLAWIVEKLRTWSDCNGDPENAFTKMEMVTNVAQYWYGEAATSSARLYYEGPFGNGEVKQTPSAAQVLAEVVTIPFGFALFPKEISWPPRALVDRAYTDIRRYEIMPRGGHFAAWEQPELLGGEIIQFFMGDCDAKALCGVKSRL